MAYINDVELHRMRAELVELGKRVERLEALVVGVDVDAPSIEGHGVDELDDVERGQWRDVERDNAHGDNATDDAHHKE